MMNVSRTYFVSVFVFVQSEQINPVLSSLLSAQNEHGITQSDARLFLVYLLLRRGKKGMMWLPLWKPGIWAPGRRDQCLFCTPKNLTLLPVLSSITDTGFFFIASPELLNWGKFRQLKILCLQNATQPFLLLLFFYCFRSGLFMQPPNKSPNNESGSFCCWLHVCSPTAGQSSALLYESDCRSCCEWLLVSQDVQQCTVLQWTRTMSSTEHARTTPAALTNAANFWKNTFLHNYV